MFRPAAQRAVTAFPFELLQREKKKKTLWGTCLLLDKLLQPLQVTRTSAAVPPCSPRGPVLSCKICVSMYLGSVGKTNNPLRRAQTHSAPVPWANSKRKEREATADWNEMDVFSMLIIYYHSFIHAFVCSFPALFPPHIISLIFMLMDGPGRWLWGFDDISPVEILGRLSPSVQK